LMAPADAKNRDRKLGGTRFVFVFPKVEMLRVSIHPKPAVQSGSSETTADAKKIAVKKRF
jgi:hypothetical protein